MAGKLQRAVGALAIALASMGAALAQQKPTPSPFQQIPPPLLQCGSFEAQDTHGRYGEAVEVQVTRANSTPSMGDDYTIVGGRCDFQAHDAVPDMVRIQWQKSIPNGYSCKAGPAGSTSFVTTTATLYACRIIIEQNIFRTSAKWASTTDGTSLVLARNASGFDKPIPFDIRICSNRRNSPVGLYVFAVDPTNSGPGKRTDISLMAGRCLLVKDANIVLIHNTGQLPKAFGHYRMRAPSAQSGVAPLPKLGPKETVMAMCKDFPQPLPNKAFYARSCDASRLAEIKNARICFDAGWANLPPSLGQPDYAPTQLAMVLDKNLDKPDANLRPDASNEAIFNPIVSGGCRDLYGIDFAAFLVGPHPPNPPWDPKYVDMITMTVQPIILN